MTRYTDEKNAQIVIHLLKAHGIKHVIASPGTTNLTFVGSIQTDPFFKVYSAVDERSAAYMACGMAAQLGEPVALSCTGATASRNYMPGLTEAYYRKLPVLAITSTQIHARVGQHIAQVIDRTSTPNDIVKVSVHLPVVKDADDVWDCELKVNRAILELKRHGGGPAHINLPTVYSRDFSQPSLAKYRVIDRWTPQDTLPPLKGRIGVFIGAHRPWSPEETEALDRFCESNNAAVFCDHTSGYHGKYRLLTALLGGQAGLNKVRYAPDILIHIGEITGDYFSPSLKASEVWRVNPDGEIRDTFRKLRHVFEMPEQQFFRSYTDGAQKSVEYFKICAEKLKHLRNKIPELPMSNIWLASQVAHRIPNASVVHFAILNSLRAWNFFDIPPSVQTASNVGGFGIDGCMSSLIGASLVNPKQLFFLITGDLAFFYDMNVLGNRHLGPNVRILLVNNGKGTEFTQYGHHGAAYGKGADRFVAASGHFGCKSRDLVRGYAEALGIEYHALDSKASSAETISKFVNPDVGRNPILVEVFVDAEDESRALETMCNLEVEKSGRMKKMVTQFMGRKNIKIAKQLLTR